MSNEQTTQAGANFLTNDQIAAGAAIECDHGAPIGRNVAIDVFDAMRAAAPVAAQANQVAVPEGFVLMPRRLTAENGAKSLLIGEFSESTRVTCHECDGSGEDSEYDSGCVECGGEGTIEQKVAVEWDTIKRIYDMAVEHLAAPSAPAVAQKAPAPSQITDATSARKFVDDWHRKHFPTDRTFTRYIMNEPPRQNPLAGDFAWQLAKALESLGFGAQASTADVRSQEGGAA